LRHKKPCASTSRRVDLRKILISVCVSLLDDVDLARAADRVDAMSLAVVENVIGIAGDVDLCNDIARVRAEHDKFRRDTAPDKQAMIRFVQRHREISEG